MRRWIVAALLIGSLGLPARAADFYLGANVGDSELKTRGDGPHLDADDTGFKVAAGVELNRWFAVELAYADLGGLDRDSDGTPVAGGADLFGAFAVGTLHVTPRGALFARAGFAFWDSRAVLVVGDDSFVLDNHGKDFAYGFGLSYDLTRRISVRLEWDRFDFDHGQEGELRSLGLRYTF